MCFVISEIPSYSPRICIYKSHSIFLACEASEPSSFKIIYYMRIWVLSKGFLLFFLMFFLHFLKILVALVRNVEGWRIIDPISIESWSDRKLNEGWILKRLHWRKVYFIHELFSSLQHERKLFLFGLLCLAHGGLLIIGNSAILVSLPNQVAMGWLWLRIKYILDLYGWILLVILLNKKSWWSGYK